MVEVEEIEDVEQVKPSFLSRACTKLSRYYNNVYEWASIGFTLIGRTAWFVGTAYFLFVIPMTKALELESQYEQFVGQMQVTNKVESTQSAQPESVDSASTLATNPSELELELPEDETFDTGDMNLGL